jgi:hypothetical protein
MSRDDPATAGTAKSARRQDQGGVLVGTFPHSLPTALHQPLRRAPARRSSKLRTQTQTQTHRVKEPRLHLLQHRAADGPFDSRLGGLVVVDSLLQETLAP